MIITSCSARKDDTVPIPNGSRTVQPSSYLDDRSLVERLQHLRDYVFQDPRAHVGTRTTYAFDLYARAGNAYKDLRRFNYQSSKSLVVSGRVDWFFLSGGYGIINALEPARRYQATFSRGIAYQKNIPFTAGLWRETILTICDEIVAKLNPKWIYVFGSRDYTGFIKRCQFWQEPKSDDVVRTRVFESTGSPGPFWISPKLNELVSSVLDDNTSVFNEEYTRFTKQ